MTIHTSGAYNITLYSVSYVYFDASGAIVDVQGGAESLFDTDPGVVSGALIGMHGRTNADNVLPACRACNISKGRKPIERWKDSREWWRQFLDRLLVAADRFEARRLGQNENAPV